MAATFGKHQPYGVYLIHISPPFKHAAHYCGWSSDVPTRFVAHSKGQGARLTQVAVRAGCELTLARVWPRRFRYFERVIKARRDYKTLCPICNPDHAHHNASRLRVKKNTEVVPF